MKILLILLAVGSFNLHAAPGECASVWLYRDCAATPMPNLSEQGTDLHHMTVFSDFLTHQSNASELCTHLRDDYNTAHAKEGLHAEVTTGSSLNEDMINIQRHRAECDLTVMKYPLKRMCDSNEKFEQKVGGTSEGLPADATCLSCDNLKKAKPELVAECLRQNILTVIQPRAVPLHSADYQAVARQVADILEENQQTPISNLQTREQLAPLEQFLHENPVSQNQNSGGGGIGRLPTQQ